MTGDTLTVVLAVVGIIVGFMTSWWFSRWSNRRSAKEISTLKSVLSGIIESVKTEPIITGAEVDRALESARFPDKVADAVVASLRLTTSPSKIDVLVRASLGALLNEHGQVSVLRLLKEVTNAFPDASPSSVVASLEELRKTGKISWSDDDVMKAGVIKVNP